MPYFFNYVISWNPLPWHNGFTYSLDAVGMVIGSMLGPNCAIAQDLKSSPTSGMSDICATLIVCVGGMLYPQRGATLSCTVRPS